MRNLPEKQQERRLNLSFCSTADITVLLVFRQVEEGGLHLCLSSALDSTQLRAVFRQTQSQGAGVPNKVAVSASNTWRFCPLLSLSSSSAFSSVQVRLIKWPGGCGAHDTVVLSCPPSLLVRVEPCQFLKRTVGILKTGKLAKNGSVLRSFINILHYWLCKYIQLTAGVFENVHIWKYVVAQ